MARLGADRRLFDNGRHMAAVFCDGEHAVARHVSGLGDGSHNRTAGFVVRIHQLGSKRRISHVEVVRIRDDAGIAADPAFDLQQGMACAQHGLLANKRDISFRSSYELQVFRFAFALKDALQLNLPIEIVFENLFAPRRYDHNVGDARCDEFVDDKLDGWNVHERKHFLGDGFGDRQKAGAVSGGYDYSFHAAKYTPRGTFLLYSQAMKPSEYAFDDPIAAVATALAPAALGIVRTSGNNSIERASSAFSRPDALKTAPGNTLVHGWIVDSGGNRIDEVVAAVYRAPKSFTGEDSVEFIGHGGPAAVLAVFRTLLRAGFRQAERGEFTFRAFANGKTDLSRAEAIQEIVDARTDAARAKAAGRLAGNLSERIHEISASIVQVLAAIEVQIEYPEDEETTKGAFDAAALREAAEQLSALHATWAAEKLYQDGARLVLAGRTNAGKSSMFNTLLKEERAIVSEIHGTTRDWLEARADFSGIPVSIFDTAGLRKTDDRIEAEGVERSKGLAADADAVLYLVDAREGLNEEDRRFIRECLEAGGPALVLVWNKCDHPDAKPAPDAEPGARAVVKTSAKKATGIDSLVQTVVSLLTGKLPGGEAGRRASLGTERQRRAVEHTLEYVNHALEAAQNGFPMDAVAQDLEDALLALGEITGEVSGADILDAVFSGFCVGK